MVNRLRHITHNKTIEGDIMTRLTLPIAAACAVFMAAALPATAQDREAQAPQNNATLNEQKRPADPATILHSRIQAALDELKTQEPENLAGKSPTTCFALLNNAQFSHRRGLESVGTELFSVVEIAAIDKGDKHKPIVADGQYAVFSDIDDLLSLHKDAFYGGAKAAELPAATLVGCASDAQDLRDAQLTLNRLLLTNVVVALDIPPQRKPYRPKHTL